MSNKTLWTIVLALAVGLLATTIYASATAKAETDPTAVPTAEATSVPTAEPTLAPTEAPTPEPTEEPTPEPTPEQWQSLGVFKLTAYCPCESCSEGYGRSTATGARATAGRTIAVDPRVIPYGSIVRINGHEYRAEDCGGGVKQKHIDIFFDTHAEVSRFGSQSAEVFIKKY